MAPHRVIIDCDPGHDDFAAIALAADSPDIRIEAIIAVNGNAPLAATTVNALDVAAALDTGCPVYAGAELPLLHRYPYPAEFHGESGMDSAGPALPAHGLKLAEGHGAAEIIRRVRAAPGEITLVCLGPLTNLALALSLDPAIAPLIRQLVFMGGGLSGGNVTAQAEFNFWADPEAAAIVLQSGVKTVMFGLDVTNHARLSPQSLAEIRASVPGPNPVAGLMDFYAGTSGDAAEAGPALHDPCPVAWLLDPEIFELTDLPVSVSTAAGPSYGATTADSRPWRDPDLPAIRVATAIDHARFEPLLKQALMRAAVRISKKFQG
jgi:inosine-uridine nucleoside N-ribohydrolase